MNPKIPDKLFFKIGEAAEITGVENYVLRYWEDEFDMLKPEKNRSGQRLYKKKDVELALEIKRLL
ncbi:MAG: MerR family transcriptional regulator, partial [Nitrospinales bacterium]